MNRRTKEFCSVLIITSCVLFPAIDAVCADAPLTIKAVEAEGAVEIYVGADLFTRYLTASTQKYPYFYPVNGPVSGNSVTTESSEPYPHHHSLFFGCDRVNGGNYWQDTLEDGQICSTSLKIIQPSGHEVVIENGCEWRRPGETPVLRDQRLIRISAPDAERRFIDFEIVLTPQKDVKIERTNHSLFAARMKPELSVAAGGVLTNASAGAGEKGTFGIASPWCDYYGTNGAVREGLAIFQHPENPLYPAKWFTRDYGFFSPTPLNWPPNESCVELRASEAVTLRYRVVVHAGSTEEAGIKDLFAAYAGAAGAGAP